MSRDKVNFEFQLKIKIKKIPDSDNQIIVHTLKESLQSFIDRTKRYVDDNVLITSDLADEIEKQVELKQLEKITIEPEVLEKIEQAETIKSFQQPAEAEPVITVPGESLVTPDIHTPTHTPTSPRPVPYSSPTPLSVPRISVPDFTRPSAAPPPPPSEISFSIPRVSLKTEPEPSIMSPSIVDEEDRATGIAILRKKMLMELKKIRSVVSEEEEF